MAPKQADTVIVGGGHAGGVCALALRRFGFTGSICLIGSENVAPYERPSLSKEMLTGKETAPRFIASSEQWRTSVIDLLPNATAIAIDRKRRAVILSDGPSISYGTLVLATGGRPRRLSFAAASPRVVLLRSEADSRMIAELAAHSRSAILVGGGVIGLEAAASLRSLGLQITIVEAADQLLSRNTPREVAGWIEQIHRREGNQILLSKIIVAIKNCESGAVCVTLKDGARLQSDFVLVGVGIEPESSLAFASGLICNNGIVVNESYRSITDANIFAVGDVAVKVSSNGSTPVRSETWAHAQASAEIAARAICGRADEPAPVAWWWTRHFDQTLQVAGSPGDADHVIIRGEHGRLYVTANSVVVGAAMLDSPKEFALARRMIAQGAIIDAERAADHTAALRDAVAVNAQSTLLPIGIG